MEEPWVPESTDPFDGYGDEPLEAGTVPVGANVSESDADGDPAEDEFQADVAPAAPESWHDRKATEQQVVIDRLKEDEWVTIPYAPAGLRPVYVATWYWYWSRYDLVQLLSPNTLLAHRMVILKQTGVDICLRLPEDTVAA